ncbi:MAG: radical SAM protein [Bdellovibrionales bacterium]
MQELISRFDQVFIDRRSAESTLARRLREIFPREKVRIVDERPFVETQGQLSASEFDRSKRNIFVTTFKGQFFKRCPGSKPGLACCNYFVLNWGLQCDMNCSYCYLQSFINTSALTIYSNLSDALEELKSIGGELSDASLRVGTGETVDSLSLDPLTLFSHDLIAFFREYPKWTLEFKTKSAFVDQFLDIQHGGNVIVSWSLNPEFIVQSEEHGTASLSARLSAAQKCLKAGYQVAFHLDPMIWFPEWEIHYGDLVDTICREFRSQDIPYLSVGALRFQPEQKPMMRERFGMKSYVTQAETFVSRDGKMRYDSKLRQNMFRFVMDRFKDRDPNWKIFMCMETPETWLQTTQQSPFKSESLQTLFDPKLPRAVERVTPCGP